MADVLELSINATCLPGALTLTSISPASPPLSSIAIPASARFPAELTA